MFYRPRGIVYLEGVHADAAFAESATAHGVDGKGHGEALAALDELGEGRRGGHAHVEAAAQQVLRLVIEGYAVRRAQGVLPRDLWRVAQHVVALRATGALQCGDAC